MNRLIVFLVLVLVSACTKKVDQNAYVDFYGLNYQDCVNKARGKTEFTHNSMQEETLGYAISNCMSEYGWIMDGK